MSKPAIPGPNPTKLPLDKMPVDRLVEVLPEGNPLLAALNAYVSPTPYTGTGDPSDHDFYATGNEISSDDDGSLLTLYGTAGNDVFTSSDEHNGGLIDVYAGAGDDIVHIHDALGTYYTIFAGSGNDSVSLEPSGSAGNVWGGSGHDTIVGGIGSDHLSGGYGADNLTGGLGSDYFMYGSALDTGDVIHDFEPGADKILFQGLGQKTFEGALSSAGMVSAGGFGYAPRAEGGITVFVDTDGVAGADLEIHVANVETIAVSDFLFF